MRVRAVYLFLPAMLLCLFVSASESETLGVRKTRPKPNQYGNVIIDNYSSQLGIVPPVVFKHWLHRSKYSCRLCHVDIGFAMMRNETAMNCEDVRDGLYCGTCHNGGQAFARVEELPDGSLNSNCRFCHSLGKDVNFRNNFYSFRKKMPKEKLGNGINWLKAEESNVIKLVDYLEKVSIKRKKLQDPEEMQISSGELMADIIFSHKKHAVWIGCELCHPAIFGVKTGGTVYKMDDIFSRRYCGSCHGSVAFPQQDCTRCHTKEVY